MEQRLSLITPQLAYDGFEQADIIVEAVFEGMAVKKQIFGELDTIAKPDCILASNTSTLNIDEIASATSRPRMVIGHHFFSPAHVMRLLEVVRGKDSSKEVIATSMALGKKLEKVDGARRQLPGFIGNRMGAPYLREAQFLVEEGASVEQVDARCTISAWRWVRLPMDDLAGLDVGWRIRKEFRTLKSPACASPLVADLLCQQGRFGQKTGRGWSKYDANRKPSPDPSDRGTDRADRHQSRHRAAATCLTKRLWTGLIYALVNEGARILEEGIALRAVDIDITYL